MSAYDKELALHDILAREISYSNSGANSETTTLIGAFLSRSAVCEGYAKAFHLLCERVGIESLIITGTGTPHYTGQSEPHAWNIVNIDGVYSHIDVTWDSNSSDEKKYVL